MVNAALFGMASAVGLPVTDQVLGWGAFRGEGEMARERRLRAAFSRLSTVQQVALGAYYAPSAPRVADAARVALGPLAPVAQALGLNDPQMREVRRQARRVVEDAHAEFRASLGGTR